MIYRCSQFVSQPAPPITPYSFVLLLMGLIPPTIRCESADVAGFPTTESRFYRIFPRQNVPIGTRRPSLSSQRSSQEAVPLLSQSNSTLASPSSRFFPSSHSHNGFYHNEGCLPPTAKFPVSYFSFIFVSYLLSTRVQVRSCFEASSLRPPCSLNNLCQG